MPKRRVTRKPPNFEGLHDREIMEHFVYNPYAKLGRYDDWYKLQDKLRVKFPEKLFKAEDMKDRWRTFYDEHLGKEFDVNLPPKERFGWEPDLSYRQKWEVLDCRLIELRKLVATKPVSSQLPESGRKISNLKASNPAVPKVSGTALGLNMNLSSSDDSSDNQVGRKPYRIFPGPCLPDKFEGQFEGARSLPHCSASFTLPKQVLDGLSFFVISKQGDLIDISRRSCEEYLIQLHGGKVVENPQNAQFVIASCFADTTSSFQTKQNLEEVCSSVLDLLEQKGIRTK